MISARLSDGTARKLMTGHPKYVLPQTVSIEVSTQALPRGDLCGSPRAKSSLGITCPIFATGMSSPGRWVFPRRFAAVSVRRGPGEEHQTELAHLNLVAVG